tara:strand:- start:131 stop:574 length:444 start_codon:yes stop_codon:yes gene_type:complete
MIEELKLLGWSEEGARAYYERIQRNFNFNQFLYSHKTQILIALAIIVILIALKLMFKYYYLKKKDTIIDDKYICINQSEIDINKKENNTRNKFKDYEKFYFSTFNLLTKDIQEITNGVIIYSLFLAQLSIESIVVVIVNLKNSILDS